MAEGKYLFVNKNLIEALALLTLATTASRPLAGAGCLAEPDAAVQVLLAEAPLCGSRVMHP